MKELTTNQLELLKMKLPDEAVKVHPTKAYLSAIKPIYVTERLNEVFGVGKWRVQCEEIKTGEKGMIVVKVKLTIPEYDIEYESYGGNDNGGEDSKNFDLGDAYKGAVTDGITKICSWMGIGADVFKGIQGHTTPQQAAPKQTAPATKGAARPAEKPTVPQATPPPVDDDLQIALQEVRQSKSRDELFEIWNRWPKFQSNTEFKNKVTQKKKEYEPK